MQQNQKKLQDWLGGTEYEGLLNSDKKLVIAQKLIQGILSTVNEFQPFTGKKIPPVFCCDSDAYDYFRTLVLKDRVAGVTAPIQSKNFVETLAKATTNFQLDNKDLNTFYASSCFDPRFLGSNGRKNVFESLSKKGFKDFQVVESFLNSGWIVYDVQQK